jgi:hypothetical protein
MTQMPLPHQPEIPTDREKLESVQILAEIPKSGTLSYRIYNELIERKLISMYDRPIQKAAGRGQFQLIPSSVSPVQTEASGI